MGESKTLKLKHPIQATIHGEGTKEWGELEFPTRFKLKHMRAFPKGFMTAMQKYAEAVEAAKTANEPPPDSPEEMNLTLMDMSPIVAKLTGVPEEAIDELDQDDWEPVSVATMGFFDSLQQETGESSSGE